MTLTTGNPPLSDPDNRAGEGAEYLAAMNAALRFLSYRPRSEAEVRRRLARRFEPSIIESAVAFLKENRYLDDAAFAQLWRRSRERSRPKGPRVLEQELRRFGVSREIIAETLEDFDAGDNAYRAGRKAAEKLINKGSNSEEFRRKIGARLQRRGFDYGVVSETVNRLWQELAEESAP